MMNYIWYGLIGISVIFGIFNGRINQVSSAAISGAVDAVSLFLVLLATICLWNGLMKIAEKAGITKLMSKLLSPLTRRLFPDLKPDSPGIKAITMNIVANFLGLGNAATPLGLQAMKEMSKTSLNKGTATDSMVTFIVMNTASIQLVPTTIAALRIKYNSTAPFDILPCIWLASSITLACGIILSKSLEKFSAGRAKKVAPTRRLYERN
jgi:spore maturation protein A